MRTSGEASTQCPGSGSFSWLGGLATVAEVVGGLCGQPDGLRYGDVAGRCRSVPIRTPQSHVVGRSGFDVIENGLAPVLGLPRSEPGEGPAKSVARSSGVAQSSDAHRDLLREPLVQLDIRLTRKSTLTTTARIWQHWAVTVSQSCRPYGRHVNQRAAIRQVLLPAPLMEERSTSE